MKALKLLFMVVAGLVFLASAHAQSTGVIPAVWQSTHFTGNPLVGKSFTFDPASGSFIEAALDADVLGKQNFVLLGENHDNPDHHTIQASIVDLLARTASPANANPALVFEMVPERLGEVLAGAWDKPDDHGLSGLAERLEWEKRGWYSWEIYLPVFKASEKYGLPMLPGALNEDLIAAVSKRGKDALAGSEAALAGLDEDLPADQIAALKEDLQQSHCGFLPETALPNMVLVQRTRDTAMAEAMEVAHSNSMQRPVVLIAGNGHGRRDRGVPLYLDRKNKASFSIGILEVSDAGQTLQDYELSSRSGTPLYDFVIFTPKFDITDHCAALRERFKTIKKKQP